MKENTKKYSFYTALIVLLLISFLILRPFFVALISSFILAYLIKPIYHLFNKKLNKKLSSLICVILVLVLIITPVFLITWSVVNQVQSFSPSSTSTEILKEIFSFGFLENFNVNAEFVQSKSLSFITSLLGSIVFQIPSLLISVFVSLFSLYYILIHWETITFTIKKYLPFKNKEILINDIKITSNHILRGILVIAMLEFIVASIGFLLSGVKLYLLAAFLVFIVAFIPGIGPAAVWIPMSLYYFFSGNTYAFIGVIITGVIITFFIETILYNTMVGKSSKINPAIMLVGVIGGISYFGLFGFIIGPLILVFTGKILKSYLDQE